MIRQDCDDPGSSDPGNRDAVARLRTEGVVAFGHVLEGSQRLVALVEADLRAAAGMTLSELEVLVRLANDPDDGCRPGDLAEQSVMTTSGATRLLDRLEDQGLVRRCPHPSDRRGLLVVLTDTGTQRLREVLPRHYESLERHLWSALDDVELHQLSALMRKVRDAAR